MQITDFCVEEDPSRTKPVGSSWEEDSVTVYRQFLAFAFFLPHITPRLRVASSYPVHQMLSLASMPKRAAGLGARAPE